MRLEWLPGGNRWVEMATTFQDFVDLLDSPKRRFR
jgi:hypothetical protein